MSCVNKTINSGISDKTAWEVITGRKPDPHNVREFGEIVFAHVPAGLRPIKSDLTVPRGRLARILGQDEMVTGYVVRYEDDGSVGFAPDVRTATGVDIDTPIKERQATPRPPVNVQPSPPSMKLSEVRMEAGTQKKIGELGSGDRARKDNEDRTVISPTEPVPAESDNASGVVQPIPAAPPGVSNSSIRRSTRLQKAADKSVQSAHIAGRRSRPCISYGSSGRRTCHS